MFFKIIHTFRLQQDMTLLNDISKDLVSDCDIDENLRPFTCLNPSNRTKQ